MARDGQGWKDTGTFPALTPSQLRTWGTVLAGLAGAGVGVTAGLAWRAFDDGDTEIGLAILAFSVLMAVVILFLILQARVIAQLLELRERDHAHAGMDRRILALELEVGHHQESLEFLGKQHHPTPPITPVDADSRSS